MKYFVAVLVCALAATVLARPEVSSVAAKESAEKVKKAHEKCQADPATAVDEAVLKNLKKSGPPPKGSAPPSGPPPANSAAHTLCISKALGWQNEDGSVNKAVIQERAEAILGSSPKLQELVDECAVAKETPEATALHIFHCYRKHAPRPEGHPEE